MKEKQLFIELSETDLKDTNGGFWGPLLIGVAVGYVFGEVMEGIYQFQKNGCSC